MQYAYPSLHPHINSQEIPPQRIHPCHYPRIRLPVRLAPLAGHWILSCRLRIFTFGR
jgi:hypothetical protein